MGFYKNLTKELENKKMEKGAANLKDVYSGFKRYAVPIAASSGIYVGLDQLLSKLDSVYKQRAFKKMVNKHPEVMESGDRLHVLEYFDSLYELNPSLAKNPTTAASFVKERMDMGMGIPTAVALELRKDRKSGKRGFRDALMEGATEPFKQGILKATGLDKKTK